MNDNTQPPTENAFLMFLKNMAAHNKLTVEKFAEYCHYTPEGLEFLKENPWFKPSTARLRVVTEELAARYDEIEWTEELDRQLEDLYTANSSHDHSQLRGELLQLLDLLPVPLCQFILEMAREEAATFFCFEDVKFPEIENDPDDFWKEEDEE